MKILFAVSDESISESIIKKYQKMYKEIIISKNVYYFNAIVKELQKDKTYERVVISEDLEPFTSNNYETIDNFIFEKLDNISDEATTNSGEDIPIILIAADRRNKNDELLVRLFGIGVYSALLGQDRSIEELCKLIQKPRSKKDAKKYYRIDANNVEYKPENESDVSETEIQNILTYFKRLGKNEDRYVESFNSIASQYTDQQLKVIIKYLPKNVKSALEENSPKYQEIVALGEQNLAKQNEVKGRRGRKKSKAKDENGGITVSSIPSGENKITKPVIIPSTNKIKKVDDELSKISEKLVAKPQPVNQVVKKVTEPEFEEREIYEEGETETETKTRKRRGRPRKLHQEIQDEEEMSQDDTKKRRGRPKKEETLEETILPEKNEVDELLDFDDLEEENNTLPGFDENENNTLPSFDDEENDFVDFEDFQDKSEESKNTNYYEEKEYEIEDIQNEESNDEVIEKDVDYDEDEEDEDVALPGFEDDEYDEENDIDTNRVEDNEQENNDIEELEDDDYDAELPGFEDENADNEQVEEPQYEYEEEEDSSTSLPGFEEEEELEQEPDTANMHEQVSSENLYNQFEEKTDLENYQNKPSTIEKLLTNNQKIVAFVGTTKNGTSFLVNNIAEMLSNQGIKTAVLDLTKNKNSYYIYTKNEEELRKTAFNCMEKLSEGIAQGIKVNRNLDIYTSLPGKEKKEDYHTILETLVQNYSLILLDCDFKTNYAYLNEAQEIYLVQSMDVLTIQPLTAYLRELKARGVLNQNKLKAVINKYTRVRGITERAIIGGMAFYNDPAMAYMTELFNRETIPYCTIPFDGQVYAKYLEALINCNISIDGYSKDFINSLRKLANMVYPLIGTDKTNKKEKYNDPKYNKYASNTFSEDVNSTLDKMRKNY